MKIDIHTHVLPPEIPRFREKFGYGSYIHLEHTDCGANMVRSDGTFFRKAKPNLYTPEIRLQECDAQGVDVQVLSTVPIMFNYGAKPADGLEIARFLNDHMASVVATNPRRFVGLGTLPLQDTALAVKELERCVKQLGLLGVQIGSNVNGENLDSERIFPFFAAAEALGAAIFVHPWDMMGQERMPKYWLPWLVGMPAEVSLAICSMIFSGVFEKLPKLRVAFAHGGGAFPGTLGRIEKGFLSRPDLVAVDNAMNPRDYLGRFYVDSLVHDGETLKFCLGLFGENQMALGTDYPFPLGEKDPGKLIESLGLPEKTRKRLLAGTALEWLGRRETDFA